MNQEMPSRRPQLRLIATADPSASPEEAAAIVAAIERFMRATAPPPAPTTPQPPDNWRQAALGEGVEREPWAATETNPWINT